MRWPLTADKAFHDCSVESDEEEEITKGRTKYPPTSSSFDAAAANLDLFFRFLWLGIVLLGFIGPRGWHVKRAIAAAGHFDGFVVLMQVLAA